MTERCSQDLTTFGMSCADLICASIALHEVLFTNTMDCRVKPGNDNHQVMATT